MSVMCEPLSMSPEVPLAGGELPNWQAPQSIKTSANVLVTGGSGFLGAHVVKELLARTDATVTCIIRSGRFQKAAVARLAEALKPLDVDVREYQHRVEVVTGALDQPNFGLAPPLYQRLANEIDTIIHGAAKVSYFGGMEDMKRTNVGGTVQILDFARQGQAKALHHVSSTGVFGATEAKTLGYLNVRVPVRAYQTHLIGYFQSKWESELKVQASRAEGLAAIVYRPTFIVGTQESGFLPHMDLSRHLLMSCFEVGGVPDVAVPIDTLPVDLVATAVVNTACRDTHALPDVNISNPVVATTAWLAEALETREGKPLGQISYDEWRLRLRQGVTQSKTVMRVLTKPMPDAPRGIMATLGGIPAARPDDVHTAYALAGTGRTCPKPSAEMYNRYCVDLR